MLAPCRLIIWLVGAGWLIDWLVSWLVCWWVWLVCSLVCCWWVGVPSVDSVCWLLFAVGSFSMTFSVFISLCPLLRFLLSTFASNSHVDNTKFWHLKFTTQPSRLHVMADAMLRLIMLCSSHLMYSVKSIASTTCDFAQADNYAIVLEQWHTMQPQPN